MTLAELKRGQQATITDVSSPYIPLKLLEMGCLPGNSVEIVQVAPFADPMGVRGRNQAQWIVPYFGPRI